MAPELHPDVEWHSSGVFPGLDPVVHGIEGVRKWWSALKEPWESFDINVERHWEEGNTLLTWVRFDAVGKGSGVEVHLPFANVFVFEEDLVRRFRSFTDLDEALAAAGIDSASASS
jgi:ketosteroid isomerase-like protein